MTATAPQMRILIIEDDRESADYLVKAFREVGYIADLASDGGSEEHTSELSHCETSRMPSSA